jgi:hypothetical protein
MITSTASLESLKKNSSLLPTNSKMQLTVTRKVPAKLHLTMPPSAKAEKSSQPESVNPLHDSLSQE